MMFFKAQKMGVNVESAEFQKLCQSFLVLAPFAAAYLYGEHWNKSSFLRRLDPSHAGAVGSTIAFFAAGFGVLLIAIFATL
jgi:hypothetical protein